MKMCRMLRTSGFDAYPTHRRCRSPPLTWPTHPQMSDMIPSSLAEKEAGHPTFLYLVSVRMPQGGYRRVMIIEVLAGIGREACGEVVVEAFPVIAGRWDVGWSGSAHKSLSSLLVMSCRFLCSLLAIALTIMYATTTLHKRKSSSVLSPADSWSSYFDTWIDEPITPPKPQFEPATASPRIAIPWHSSSSRDGDWGGSHDVDSWLHSWLEAIDARSPPIQHQQHAQKEPLFGHLHARKLEFRRYDAPVR